MSPPLTLNEIRNFMLTNGGKVTNHDLVKHFKESLTHPDSQNEARKQFKTFVNMLATIKAEDKGNGKMEKFLILKPKYVNDLPSPDDSSVSMNASFPMSPSMRSLNESEMTAGSPSRLPPPPYRAPPVVSTPPTGQPIKLPQLEQETESRFKDCVDEFQAAMSALRPGPIFETPPATPNVHRQNSQDAQEVPAPAIPPRKRSNASLDQMVTPPIESSTMGRPSPIYAPDNMSLYDTGTMRSITGEMVVQEMYDLAKSESESKMTVKEATKKFNRIASEEEKTATPSPKRLAEKKVQADTSSDTSNVDGENLMSLPKAREWIVSAARANYQELSKLAKDENKLVRLQDPTNFTALHWAAKHGNENVVKLIAGTYKADVNARTNGGYTPLHVAMQFGRDNIFELLQNVYNANRDLTDWSGKKPLDYRKPQTSVSASTYSKIKARKKHSEKDLGFLRIGSLNVRVKKTTEAFSNFLGVGPGTQQRQSSHPQQRYRNNHHGTASRHRTSAPLAEENEPDGGGSESAKPHRNDHLKAWNSVDDIPVNQMPPPKFPGAKKRQRTKRSEENEAQCHSMPSTPSQQHRTIDDDADAISDTGSQKMGNQNDDSDFGFDSSWNRGPMRPTYI